MSSVPDLAPFLRKPRAAPTHKVRPMKLEWNKLLAEATEKDFEVEKDVVAEDNYYDDDTEIETQELVDGQVNGGETQSERPLNLCNKSHTMPMSVNCFANSFDVLDLSAKKKKPEPKIDRNSCESDKSSTPCTNPKIKQFNENSDKNSINANSVEDLLENKENCQNNRNKNDSPGIKSLNSQKIQFDLMGSTEKLKICNKNEKLDKQNNYNCSEKKIVSSNMPIERVKPFKDDVHKKLDIPAKKEKSRQTEKVISNSETPVSKKSNHVSTPIFQKFAVPAAPKPRDSTKVLTINKKTYQVLAPLGKGGSSKVYLVLNSDYELLAVKRVKLSDVSESTKNDYLNEIQHLLKMQHCKHVIKLYDHQYLSSQKVLLVVMERGETDLSRFLKDKASSDEGISPELIMYYWTEMLMAVKSIHDNNIIHRDLKPANFLLVSGRLKLIDFGIASSIQTEQTSVLMESQSGTFNYMSPEALQEIGFDNKFVLKIGRKTDVWSLGCILYYFIYKKTPYQELVHIKKMKAITDPNYVVPFPKIPGVPDFLIESCKRCLIHDTKKRASIEELLAFRNRPLLSLSQVLGKLEEVLSPEEYEKAEKAFEDITNTV